MAFTIPNFSGTIEYPVGSGLYPQAQVDAVDWAILGQNGGVGGVSSGCAVTQRGAGANLSVDVGSGTTVVNDVESIVSAGNLVATAAHATLPRFDLVTVNNVGTKVYTAGTAASTPVFPAIPANSVVLAAVFRRPADDIIQDAEIVDKRIDVPSPVPASSLGWTTITKTSDQTRTSTTTLTADSALTFAMSASTKYRIRIHVFASVDADADLKWGFTGPAAPTLVNAWSKSHGTTGTVVQALFTAYETTGIAVTSTGTAVVPMGVHIDLAVHNAGSAAAFSFTWAQNTSSGDPTTVLAGSYIEYQVV